MTLWVLEEMMKYTACNILQQATQAILAQVNQSAQGVLQLLG
jgi:flagellin